MYGETFVVLQGWGGICKFASQALPLLGWGSENCCISRNPVICNCLCEPVGAFHSPWPWLRQLPQWRFQQQMRHVANAPLLCAGVPGHRTFSWFAHPAWFGGEIHFWQQIFNTTKEMMVLSAFTCCWMTHCCEVHAIAACRKSLNLQFGKKHMPLLPNVGIQWLHYRPKLNESNSWITPTMMGKCQNTQELTDRAPMDKAGENWEQK